MPISRISADPMDQSFSQYRKQIWKYPILERDEEISLAKRWLENGDTDAAHQLVTSHLRLVVSIATKYRGFGLPIDDLISEGTVGLMKAVNRYDPTKNVRLSTYAMWWIKAAVIEYVLQSWSLVKIGTVESQRKLFFNLRRFKASLGNYDNYDLAPEDACSLAQTIGVPVSEVIQMNRRIVTRDFSLNTPLSGEESESDFQESLMDESPSQEIQYGEREEMEKRKKILTKIISELPLRDQYIFIARRLNDEKPTLTDLGSRFGISRERVRQIEVKAFNYIKRVAEKYQTNLSAQLQ